MGKSLIQEWINYGKHLYNLILKLIRKFVMS